MIISELIRRLEEIQGFHGDLDCVIPVPYESNTSQESGSVDIEDVGEMDINRQLKVLIA